MSLLPRLILISGWAHDSSAMEDLRKCLESAVDVSSISTGNLWSAETETCSPSSYARNLGKMIEKTGSPAFVAGWSLGGMIALETAAYRPDLIAGLILISSTAKFRAGQNWASGVSNGALRAMTGMLKHNPRGVFATFFKNVAHTFEEKVQRIGTKTESHGLLPTPPTFLRPPKLASRRREQSLWLRRLDRQKLEETIALKIEKACAMNPLELSAGLEYLSEKDLRNEATKVNIPALILHGKQDAIIPVEAGLALKSLFPVSQIRVYENCGHGLPWQNPQTAAEDIIKFIEACANKRAI